MNGRGRIARAFAAARDYDREARVQRVVARRLARDIAGLDFPDRPRVLEIGCGTGFLTEALLAQGVAGEWLVTDIAPDMVARCRARIGERPGLTYAVLDGEHGARPGAAPFDLICSSLAMQWFDDQRTAVARLIGWLQPGGRLLFTSLAGGTFAEWRAAHDAAGVPAGLRVFPGREWFDAIAPGARAAPHRVDRYVDRCDNGLDFMRSLRAIGADTPLDGHAPLGPAAMRRVMRAFDARGGGATYEVVTCHYRRESEG